MAGWLFLMCTLLTLDMMCLVAYIREKKDEKERKKNNGASNHTKRENARRRNDSD